MKPKDHNMLLVEVQDFKKHTNHFRGICKIYFKLMNETERSQHVTS